ncbi:hypothetical protein MP228_000896 [Amoeboaphelidium protococcarum]|nr:hypothetical protein MP228_000896 [Amoeboaphelidium protococcarum]
MVSLRSKRQRKNRQLRRQSIYGPMESARIERLAKKQAELVENVLVNDVMAVDTDHVESAATAPKSQSVQAEDSSMEIDGHNIVKSKSQVKSKSRKVHKRKRSWKDRF